MRHFSGRGFTDRFCTLWAGWVIKGNAHSVIHTGDSGYGEHFKEIGEKYGPFDLTMVECGQYNVNWHYIHMMPEETVQAHIDLKGKHLIPIHWGRFNLALHTWTDPVVRASKTAKEKDVSLISPEVGQVVMMTPPLPEKKWWQFGS
jgi:L-ascorbate metabolism protein UlaG (beta-lactamase superfamily)